MLFERSGRIEYQTSTSTLNPYLTKRNYRAAFVVLLVPAKTFVHEEETKEEDLLGEIFHRLYCHLALFDSTLLLFSVNESVLEVF